MRWPFLPSNAKQSISVAAEISPSTTELTTIGVACSGVLLGSTSATSGRSPTTKVRGLLTPKGPDRPDVMLPERNIRAAGRPGRSGP